MSVKKIESLEIRRSEEEYIIRKEEVEVRLNKKEKAELDKVRNEMEDKIEQYRRDEKKKLRILDPKELTEKKHEITTKTVITKKEQKELDRLKDKEDAIMKELDPLKNKGVAIRKELRLLVNEREAIKKELDLSEEKKEAIEKEIRSKPIAPEPNDGTNEEDLYDTDLISVRNLRSLVKWRKTWEGKVIKVLRQPVPVKYASLSYGKFIVLVKIIDFKGETTERRFHAYPARDLDVVVQMGDRVIVEPRKSKQGDLIGFISEVLESSGKAQEQLEKEYEEAYYAKQIKKEETYYKKQIQKRLSEVLKKETEVENRLGKVPKKKAQVQKQLREVRKKRAQVEVEIRKRVNKSQIRILEKERQKKLTLKELVSSYKDELHEEIRRKYKNAWYIFGETKYETVTTKIPIHYPFYIELSLIKDPRRIYEDVIKSAIFTKYNFYNFNKSTALYNDSYLLSPTEKYISKFKRGEEVEIIQLYPYHSQTDYIYKWSYHPANVLCYLNGNNVYRATRDYSLEELKLLIMDIEDKERKKFERLKHKFSLAEEETKRRRERIPENVRIAVWRRDEGKCVECGSKENLEYDHIIPVSKGGSNTARNIQLLCEQCNREKSDKII